MGYIGETPAKAAMHHRQGWGVCPILSAPITETSTFSLHGLQCLDALDVRSSDLNDRYYMDGSYSADQSLTELCMSLNIDSGDWVADANTLIGRVCCLSNLDIYNAHARHDKHLLVGIYLQAGRVHSSDVRLDAGMLLCHHGTGVVWQGWHFVGRS